MAFIPSSNAQNISKQTALFPNLILEISGIPVIFGSQEISRLWKFDDGFEFDTDNLRFDTPFPDANSRDYISLNKTSSRISQQVLPDKKGTSSTLTMDIELVDINGEVTELLKSGNYVQDLMGTKCSIYLGFKNSSHPEDSIPLLDGFIQKVTPTNGTFVLTISHSENKKRQEILQVYNSTLTASITDSDTVLQVESTKNLIETADQMTSFIRIDDEVMEVSSIDSDTQLTVIRSRIGTIAIAHDNEADVSSVYGLTGNAIDLALKLYLSGGDEFYSSISATSFNQVNSDSIQDSIFFQDNDLFRSINATIGDSITSSGATNGQNNGTFLITNIIKVSNGTYILCEGAGFVFENPTSASISFKSKYNVFNSGLGLIPFDVDIETHEAVLAESFSSFPEYEFYLEDAVNAKDFVDGELYFPSGLYSINRKAKISCRFTKPPLANEGFVVFNSDNIIDINNIKPTRSTTNFHYNSIVFRYEKSSLEDKFRAGKIILNPSAKNRIDNINHTLKIESSGLRRNGATDNLIDRQINRFYQRYQYGAILYKNIQIAFKDSWNLEIGDVIQFGGNDIKIPDLNNGTTYTPIKLLEIINKDQDLIRGIISFDCLETGFDLQARYAVISPSSYITANSTVNSLELELSFYTGSVIRERQKWEGFVGQRIRVRSEDYSFDEIVTINSLSAINDNVINISTLSTPPYAGLIVEIPKYDESSSSLDATYKIRYSYLNQQQKITSVTSGQIFDVTDGSQFIDGGFIEVNSDDYTRASGDNPYKILNIVGNTITLEESLDFVPIIGDNVEKASFKDGGFAYRLI